MHITCMHTTINESWKKLRYNIIIILVEMDKNYSLKRSRHYNIIILLLCLIFLFYKIYLFIIHILHLNNNYYNYLTTEGVYEANNILRDNIHTSLKRFHLIRSGVLFFNRQVPWNYSKSYLNIWILIQIIYTYIHMTCIFRKLLKQLLYVIQIYNAYIYAICQYIYIWIPTFIKYNCMNSRYI